MSRLQQREVEVLNSHDLIICVHDKDIQTLRTKGVRTDAVSIATIRGEERLPYQCPASDEEVILFFGALHNPMNIDGARYAATEVLPAICQRRPKARLIIAGSGAGPEINRLGELEGVSVLGYIPDLATLFHQAKVLLLPLRIGSGIKGRVLEAMEAGTPVVGTTMAAEGIPVMHGENMIVVDELEGMVDWTVRLLSDGELRCRISRSARRFVEETYSWENTYGRIHECLVLANENYMRGARHGRG